MIEKCATCRWWEPRPDVSWIDQTPGECRVRRPESSGEAFPIIKDGAACPKWESATDPEAPS